MTSICTVAVFCFLCAATLAQERVALQFTNSDVRDVILLYERLTAKNIIRDNSVTGTVTLAVAEPVSAKKAVQLIEQALFANRYSLVDRDIGTIEAVGIDRDARTVGVPTYSSPEKIPSGERVFSFIFKLKYRNPTEVMHLLVSEVAPNVYTSFVPDPKSQTLVVTDRTSVIRHLIEVVRALDVPVVPSPPARSTPITK